MNEPEDIETIARQMATTWGYDWDRLPERSGLLFWRSSKERWRRKAADAEQNIARMRAGFMAERRV